MSTTLTIMQMGERISELEEKLEACKFAMTMSEKLEKQLKKQIPVWHDLRNNFNDLPEEKHTVILLTEVGPTTAQYDTKYESFFRMNEKLEYCIFIAPICYVAWCEIPDFKEEIQ